MHQRATVDIDLVEHLFEQHRTRDQRELPLRGLALQLQFEVTLQAAAVALQHGEKQTVLLSPGTLVRQQLPAVAFTPGDALGADAVVLLQRGFQQPEQAVVLGQDEGAFADQWLRQGAQVFFLDKAALDHRGLGQLIAELLQVEGVGLKRQQQRAKEGDQFHDKALSTASVKTLGDASCISRVAISTATCTVLARVRRSPLARSVIR